MSYLYGFVGRVENDHIVYTTGSTWLPIQLLMANVPAKQLFKSTNAWFEGWRRRDIAKDEGIDGWSYATSKEEYLKVGGNYHYLLEDGKVFRFNSNTKMWEPYRNKRVKKVKK